MTNCWEHLNTIALELKIKYRFNENVWGFTSQRASKRRRTFNRAQRHTIAGAKKKQCYIRDFRKESPPIRPSKVAPFSHTLTPEKEGKRLRNALAGTVREQLATERRARRSFYIRALSIDHWSHPPILFFFLSPDCLLCFTRNSFPRDSCEWYSISLINIYQLLLMKSLKAN
jgi:hypothetical protein